MIAGGADPSLPGRQRPDPITNAQSAPALRLRDAPAGRAGDTARDARSQPRRRYRSKRVRSSPHRRYRSGDARSHRTGGLGQAMSNPRRTGGIAREMLDPGASAMAARDARSWPHRRYSSGQAPFWRIGEGGRRCSILAAPAASLGRCLTPAASAVSAGRCSTVAAPAVPVGDARSCRRTAEPGRGHADSPVLGGGRAGGRRMRPLGVRRPGDRRRCWRGCAPGVASRPARGRHYSALERHRSTPGRHRPGTGRSAAEAAAASRRTAPAPGP